MLLVVDDDPTGAQDQAGVPLLLEWDPDVLRRSLADAPRALHLLTNSRALDADDAYAVVRGAAEAAHALAPEAEIVLRGDSTLRAHLLPEYLALRDALDIGSEAPLLLVPALPAAGRVTLGGRHWLRRDGAAVALEDTEYARDGQFAYRSGRLLEWAQERSGGRFAARAGREIGLATLRGPGGEDVVARALASAAGADPMVVAPDADTVEDLHAIARGLRRAWADGARVIVRCAPAFVGVLAGTAAAQFTPLPSAPRGVLVIAGSHVPATTLQLTTLAARHPGVTVEVDPEALCGAGAEEAIARAAARLHEQLADGRLAVLQTSRAIAGGRLGFAGGMRIARGVAAVLARTRDAADVVVSKGGITSAVNVRHGMGARRAHVVGPVAPGVSLWRIPVQGAERPFVVFPGNVGGPAALADLVDGVLSA